MLLLITWKCNEVLYWDVLILKATLCGLLVLCFLRRCRNEEVPFTSNNASYAEGSFSLFKVDFMLSARKTLILFKLSCWNSTIPARTQPEY